MGSSRYHVRMRFHLGATLLVLTILNPMLSLAQMQLPPVKVDVDPRLQESYDIIDEIKKQNPPDIERIEFRSGLLQLFSNSPDGIELNELKTLPFWGLESVTHFSKAWGIEVRGYYAANVVFPVPADSPNGTSAYQLSYDGGISYRVVLDATRAQNYVAIKALYHSTENNFKIKSGSNSIFMKSYRGFSFGVERSIPVTPKIEINGDLDTVFINEAKSDSTEEFVQTGIGFHVRGSCSYRVDWFGDYSRIAAAYWQGGFVNRFSPGSQDTTGRTSHVQTFRAVSLSMVMNF